MKGKFLSAGLLVVCVLFVVSCASPTPPPVEKMSLPAGFTADYTRSIDGLNVIYYYSGQKLTGVGVVKVSYIFGVYSRSLSDESPMIRKTIPELADKYLDHELAKLSAGDIQRLGVQTSDQVTEAIRRQLVVDFGPNLTLSYIQDLYVTLVPTQ